MSMSGTGALRARLRSWRPSGSAAVPGSAVDEVAGGGSIAGHRRTWVALVPRDAPPAPALLVVLHGSMQDAARIRRASGHGFDRLAGEHGAIVVFPEAYRGAWNDSRVAGRVPARDDGVDDTALVEAILAAFAASHGVEPSRTFAVGFSAGGQLVFTLAATMPGAFAGLAAIGATWPAPGNHRDPAPTTPVPMLLMNGTADPIVPFGGGTTSLFGFRPRGAALSAADTARVFTALNGITAAPVVTELPHQRSSGRTSVTLAVHAEEGRAPVWDYTVHGGGHVVPNPRYRAPRIVGRTTHDVDAPAAVWDFFTSLAVRA